MAEKITFILEPLHVPRLHAWKICKIQFSNL